MSFLHHAGLIDGDFCLHVAPETVVGYTTGEVVVTGDARGHPGPGAGGGGGVGQAGAVVVFFL